MADYRVEWSVEARGDFLDIIGFIAQQSPRNAGRIAARIDEAARALRRFPLRGRRLPELQEGLALEIRENVLAPWRLLYSVDANVVRIIALVDGRRDVVAWLNREQTRFRANEP